jgi:hypothetical protein
MSDYHRVPLAFQLGPRASAAGGELLACLKAISD